MRWITCILVQNGIKFFLKAKSFANREITLWMVALLPESEAVKYQVTIQVGEEPEQPAIANGAQVRFQTHFLSKYSKYVMLLMA